MTETQRASELLGNPELLVAVLEHAPGFIMAIDVSGKLLFINRVLPQHDLKNVIGSHFLQYLPPEQHDSIMTWFRAALDAGVTKTYESSVVGPHGETLWMTTNMGPMRSGEHIVGVVIVAQEITELRRTQLEFAGAQRMAAVGTLAAGIAHEINTPIQFVNDSIQFLREGTHDILSVVDSLQGVARVAAQESPSLAMREALSAVAKAEEEADLVYLRENVTQAFDRCVDGLGRVASIVTSIREFAHPACKEMAPVDLNHAVMNTLTIARNEYTHLAQLDTDLSELPLVTCHIDQINQAVLNLIVNAAHAIGDVVQSSGTMGRLSVRTRVDGDDVVISVSDTGAGISEAARDHIFEPFFTTKEVGKGTGQGLAIAWAIVTTNHGGVLSYESVLGKGTTFFVRLPRAGKPHVPIGVN